MSTRTEYRNRLLKALVEIDRLQEDNTELVRALENARNVLAGIATGDLQTVKPDSPALAMARAALAKAKGEA